MRADGRRTKGLTAIEQAIPHIMPKRVDAQNYVTEYVDEEIIKDYIRSVKQQKGVRMSRMAVIIAAYYLAALQHPYINRFVVGSRVYDRNHFCVSFVMLKKRADGSSDQTTVKVFMEPTDDIFTINQRINDVIEKNSEPKHENNTDKFAAFMFSLPVLPYLVMALVRFLDRFGLLPRAIIDLSPFHTSMFITNLASINTTHIYHHVYEFGTTSVFPQRGQVHSQLPRRGAGQEADPHQRGHGRAHLHRPPLRPVQQDPPAVSAEPGAAGAGEPGVCGDRRIRKETAKPAAARAAAGLFRLFRDNESDLPGAVQGKFSFGGEVVADLCPVPHRQG